mmetsp:Transcript_6930/g.12305  ORF Transcript_6930/g.12305 Transcript_6930/m.12305 type:complete len:261 (-) Transcript_6930:51-833(-)
MSGYTSSKRDEAPAVPDAGLVVLSLVAEFAERVQDWSATLAIHLALRCRKLKLMPSMLDATCSLPRSLLMDTAVMVAGAVSREAGASVRLRLAASGIAMRAFFECPLCQRCSAGNAADGLPVGTRVKIVKQPHRYNGQLGVLCTPSDSEGPYNIRLDDGRVASVPDVFSLAPMPAKFCHHFRGLGSQSHWLQKVRHAWVSPSERRTGALLVPSRPSGQPKNFLASRRTTGETDEGEETVDMLDMLGDMVDAVDNLPRAEI